MQGILGGTFDPPHIAHLAMARAAFEQLKLEAVRLMPAGDPWQKSDSTVSPAADRLAMVRLVADEEDWLVADDTEVRRDGPSYTVDTVEQLPERAVLILGADAALGIPTWHRGEDLVGLVDLAVVPRPGVARSDVEDAVGGSVTWLEMDPIDLSSTKIRVLATGGGEFRDLVPPEVFAYIEEHDLYVRRGSRHPESLSSSRMKKNRQSAAPDAVLAARTAAAAIDSKSGEDIALLDLSDLLVVTDVFLLATGTSRRNVLTLADEAVDALRGIDRQPIRKEGTDHGKWVLLDYGDVVIHVFDKPTREYYDLERLWAGAPRIEFEPTSSTTEA
ncbi:MAG: nicotinate (nicotinamide) nucleotide adenylyltransferase [Actinomycetota bacterium]